MRVRLTIVCNKISIFFAFSNASSHSFCIEGINYTVSPYSTDLYQQGINSFDNPRAQRY